MADYQHQPVLLHEVLELLAPQPGQKFIDATLGGGGYTSAIAEKVKPAGKILAIDLDQAALDNQKSKLKHQNIILAHGNFAQIDHVVRNHHFPSPDGIVADLGLSSFHLDASGRGFSFQKKEVLDMRFDESSQEPDARFIVNNFEPARLEKIFREFGEEKFSKKIAQAIVNQRVEKEIKYTAELYQLIESALPKPLKHRASDSARRVFQALRMEVNHELESLQAFLQKAFDLMSPGGRLAIVSFHSLEDRMVKQFFVKLSKGCVCPPEFPQCVCGREPEGRLLTKKPVMAKEAEQKQNSRSKPAKLRAIQKV